MRTVLPLIVRSAIVIGLEELMIGSPKGSLFAVSGVILYIVPETSSTSIVEPAARFVPRRSAMESSEAA